MPNNHGNSMLLTSLKEDKSETSKQCWNKEPK